MVPDTSKPIYDIICETNWIYNHLAAKWDTQKRRSLYPYGLYDGEYENEYMKINM